MAGTTTKSRETQRKGSDVQDLLINFNRLVDDVEAARSAVQNGMPGALLSDPANKTGTSDLKTWRTEAFSFAFRGKVTSAAAQEKALTATTHDMAASKQAIYVLTVRTDGSTFTITKATDQTIGTLVYPTGVDNEIIVGYANVTTGVTGYTANTDNFAVDGTKIDSITFTDPGAVGSAALLAAKIGDLGGTAITE